MLLLIANLLISYLETTHAYLDGKAKWMPQYTALKKAVADSTSEETDEPDQPDAEKKAKSKK